MDSALVLYLVYHVPRVLIQQATASTNLSLSFAFLHPPPKPCRARIQFSQCLQLVTRDRVQQIGSADDLRTSLLFCDRF